MSTEQHIDPEAIELTQDEQDAYKEDTAAALNAADEKLRELAQAYPVYVGSIDAGEYEKHLRSPEVQATLASAKGIDPGGQEYAYGVAYTNRTGGHIWHLGARDLHDAVDRHKELVTEGYAAWVERALLGTWERVDR